MTRFVNEINNKCELEKQFAQQHILEKGSWKFGEEGRKAAVKEMRQSHDQKCFQPTSVKELNAKERKKAQPASMHLTKK